MTDAALIGLVGFLGGTTVSVAGLLLKIVFVPNGHVSHDDLKGLEASNESQHTSIHGRITSVDSKVDKIGTGIGRIEGHLGIRVQE